MCLLLSELGSIYEEIKNRSIDLSKVPKSLLSQLPFSAAQMQKETGEGMVNVLPIGRHSQFKISEDIIANKFE